MLDSLVRVSRRVGGATDLLATDMRPVPKHSKETTQIPVPLAPQLKAPAPKYLSLRMSGTIRTVRSVKCWRNAASGLREQQKVTLQNTNHYTIIQ